MTMDRNSVAHALVRFYLAHGSVLPLLDVLTIREINKTCNITLTNAISVFMYVCLCVYS